MPVSFLRGAKRLRWRETDRILALALQAYEDSVDPSTGQDVALSTDPRLADYWTTMAPVQDYAHRALAEAQARAEKGNDHPQTLRHILGLREGWEDVLAAGSESAAPDQ